MTVGDKIRFAEEKRPYRVRACNERYAVCTKPFNVRHTVLYTVVDFQHNIRGTENLIFCCGAETDEQCRHMLERISTGDTQISHRNWVPLVMAGRPYTGKFTAPDGAGFYDVYDKSYAADRLAGVFQKMLA